MTEPKAHNESTSEPLPVDRLGEDAVELVGRESNALEAIRETYAEDADKLARMSWLNRLVTGRYRQTLFGTADGRVLDVACGMGTNVRYLPETVEYVGIDISPAMIEKAEEQFDQLVRGETVFEMDAQSLAFADDSFDTVISSLSTCTFPDPVVALDEMNRVCKPDGQILLLEHGRSSVGPIARFQDWRADAHFEKHRCRWNQDPLELVSASALSLRTASTGMLGIITAIRANPT